MTPSHQQSSQRIYTVSGSYVGSPLLLVIVANEGFKDAENIVKIMVVTVSGKGGEHIRRYYSSVVRLLWYVVARGILSNMTLQFKLIHGN